MIINVCIGSACHLKGSYEIINRFNDMIKNYDLNDRLKVKAAFCLDNCKGAVSVKFNDNIYTVQPDTAEEFFETVVRGKV